MANCAACHVDLPPDALFCPHCGHRTGAPVQPEVEAPVATISGLATLQGAGESRGRSLAEGEEFHGRYVVERQLGAGAMGVVYAARDRLTAQTVALKVINPALADRPSARDRFLREGMMARDIRHQNIVAMYDVGDADGQLYLVMEYLNGETLRKWLRRCIQDGIDIPFETARGIIRTVLEGLCAAHARGVVHRDLKPENVMLLGDPLQGRFDLKVLDFGIARAIGASSQVTTTSSSTGTPLYMAPEQKTAADTVGPPADVYAVTAMLYELLIGVAPEGRWGAPSRERNDLTPDVDALVETGLASRPKSRFQTAAEFIAALDRIGRAHTPPPLHAPSDPAPAPPPSPEEVPSARRNWLAVTSPAMALWNRLSRRQKIAIGVVTAVTVLVVAVIANIIDNADPDWYRNLGGGMSQESVSPPPPGSGKDESGLVSGGGSAQEVSKERPVDPPPPPPVADMNMAGRWCDEVTGRLVAQSFVDVVQQGNAINGPIWSVSGIQVGTFSGRVQGTTFEYAYRGINGERGTGRGQLTADGMHLDVVVTDALTGGRERHTLHRNHLPHQ